MLKRSLATAALALAATAVFAHQGVQNPAVMARMHSMMGLDKDLKLMISMAKGEIAMDASAAQAAALRIQRGTPQISPLFQAPETDPKSEALPAIWDEFDTFTALARDLEKAAAKAAPTIQDRPTLAQATAYIGGACRACHKRYRQQNK
ncbi:cytochrome c [Tropicibacter sp. R16_0]|uniref:c-type cytochrome n=1 Tax=Tropicibacter sp. R16_0 TaxID=2821102 RepID=UPI001ADB4732|nr:cytochrome c [Tropicibacter sp. R16_0]MBO9450281.1 cytochrome c [Tropicibacter sp. R16_0]